MASLQISGFTVKIIQKQSIQRILKPNDKFFPIFIIQHPQSNQFSFISLTNFYLHHHTQNPFILHILQPFNVLFRRIDLGQGNQGFLYSSLTCITKIPNMSTNDLIHYLMSSTLQCFPLIQIQNRMNSSEDAPQSSKTALEFGASLKDGRKF